MSMFNFSPETQAKFAKFKKNKKAYRSLIILGILFLLSLPAELLFNDKPIMMRIDGHWFFPVFQSYTFKDLGGELETPVVSYRSEAFANFVAGKRVVANLAVLYPEPVVPDPGLLGAATDGKAGADDSADSAAALLEYSAGTPRSFWALYPPFRHSYRSSYTSAKISRQYLASPFATTVDGEEVPGAIAEGHLLGTDRTGKDVLARLVYGFRLSLLFGLALAVSSTVLGCILGGIQGFFGGLVDLLGQRLTEIWGALPRLFLLMILSDFLSKQGNMTGAQHIVMLFLILNLTSWMGMAAHMRAQFLRARNLDYVKAAKALGVSDTRIMFKHILPNSLTPIVTFLPFSVSSGILALVSLDFLGFGLRYPAPSLGELLSQGQNNLEAWWIMTPTFIMLASLMILLTFVGDGIRNAFDPRFK